MDISICNFYYVDENGNMIYKENLIVPIQNEYISGRKVLEEKLAEYKRHYWVVSWNKLYKCEIFESCKYPVGKIHEGEYVLHMIYEGKSVECISDCLLYYVQRQGSIMSKPNAKHYIDFIDAMIRLGEYYYINEYNDKALTANFRLIYVYIRLGYFDGAYTKKQNEENISRYRKMLLNMLKRKMNNKFKIQIILRLIDPYCRYLMMCARILKR